MYFNQIGKIICRWAPLLNNSQEEEDDDDDDDEEEEEDGSDEDEDEVEPKLKYERIGNAMNTILNGEECASCMAVHTKVLEPYAM